MLHKWQVSESLDGGFGAIAYKKTKKYIVEQCPNKNFSADLFHIMVAAPVAIEWILSLDIGL